MCRKPSTDCDRHLVSDLEIVLIGQRLRNEYAVALRLIAQMLAFDYLVVAVVVDFAASNV